MLFPMAGSRTCLSFTRKVDEYSILSSFSFPPEVSETSLVDERPIVVSGSAPRRPPQHKLERSWARFTCADRRFGLPEWIALVLYAGLVAWLTVHHEPWPDEAQAWLIARDSSFLKMLRQVHYEGSPALWHVLLWIEVRLHVTYAGMHWVSSALGLASAWLLLRYSPFPRWAKLMLPFGAFLLFHAPVIARSYGLSILLMLALAALYRSNRANLLAACLCCGLLANTSLYGFAAAVGFAVLVLGRAFRRSQKSSVAGLLIVCGFMAVAVQQTIPAPDAAFSFATQLNKSPVIRRTFAALTGIPVNEDAIRIKKRKDDAGKAEALQVAAAELKAGKVSETPKLEPTGLRAESVRRTKMMAHAAIFIVSSFPALAALFYIALAGWLVAHRRLRVILPFALMLMAGAVLNYTEHHVLMLWGALVAVLWMAWPGQPARLRWIDPAFCVLLFAVAVEQAGWSVNASKQDVYGTFDPSMQVAVFLQNNAAGHSIDTVTYYEVGSQPYLPGNPYRNVATTYWPWTIDKEPADDLRGLVRGRPDMIVASTNVYGTAVLGNVLRTHIAFRQPFYADKVVTRLQALGYRETHRFCGRQPMHFGYAEENCILVLEPGTQPLPDPDSIPPLP